MNPGPRAGPASRVLLGSWVTPAHPGSSGLLSCGDPTPSLGSLPPLSLDGVGPSCGPALWSPGPRPVASLSPDPAPRTGRAQLQALSPAWEGGHVPTLALPSLAVHPGAWASSPVSLLLKRQLAGETEQRWGRLPSLPPPTTHPGRRGSGVSSTQMPGDEAASPRPHRGLAPAPHRGILSARPWDSTLFTALCRKDPLEG